MRENLEKTKNEAVEAMDVKGQILKDYEEEKIKEDKIFIMDCETGGFDPNINALLDVHLRSFQSNYKKTFHLPMTGVVEHDALLVNKKNYIDLLTITTTEGNNRLLEISEILKRNCIIIGHNIKFDINFLKNFFNHLGCYTICTKSLAKKIYPGLKSYSLEYLSREILGEYDEELAHTSAYDSILTEKLLLKILEDDKEDNLKLKWLAQVFRDSKESCKD